MSVATTLAALKTKFEAVSPAPRRVYDRPAEAVSLADFPAVVLTLAPGQSHAWGAEAVAGRVFHRYTVAAYWFVGTRATGLPELHTRVLGVPEGVMTVLAADVTLGGRITVLGDVNGENLFTYTIGPIKWGDGDYFGVKCLIPIEEKPLMDLG